MYLFISLKAVPGLGSFALIPNTVEKQDVQLDKVRSEEEAEVRSKDCMVKM
jgi:hypothetical protein